MKTMTFLYVVLLFAKSDIAFSQGKIHEINERTQKLAEKYIVKENIPGMSVSVSLNDSLVFSAGFGFSDIENKAAVDPSKTKFRIASITKTMTAATIARLSELDRIDLRKSVYYYLDSLPKKEYDFTVEEVGGHISGLKRVAGTEKYSCDNTYNKNDFYSVFSTDKLLFQPSTRFGYSNYGYKLLGIVIEKITGESIIENHKKYIVDVIGLKNTMPESTPKDSLTAKFYIKKKDKIIDAPCLDCTFKYSQGCYLSTSEDLIKLGNAYMFPGRILKKETLIELIKSKKLKNGLKTNYGLGFMTSKDFYGNYFYGHNGGYEGSRSILRIYPNSKIVISILANRDIEDIDGFAAEIANNYISGLR